MSIVVTGPALANDLTRSVVALREAACARPARRGWREALGPAAAADAARMAIVALIDALLALLQEFLSAQAGRVVVPAGLAPSPTEAVRAGLDVFHGDDTDGAGPPCDPASSIAGSHAARRRRASNSGPAPSTAPADGTPTVAASPRRSIPRQPNPPRGSWPSGHRARASRERARRRVAGRLRTRLRLRA